MGKNNKQEEPKDIPSVKFDFFKQEIEDEGIRAMTAGELGDPEPNYSGSFNLDYDLFVPFPEGRITEIYGPEGTCKTTLTLEVAGNAIRRGKTVLYVNMEKNLNLSLIRTIRTLRPIIDRAVENMEATSKGKKAPHPECPFWIVNATNGEQALEAMRKFASMMPKGIAILDSIDAAQPSAVLSGEIGENKVGNLAKLMSDAMHKLIGVAESNKVALIFVNQVRDKITMYGDPKTTSGGYAIKFYASQRIELKKPNKDDIIVDANGERIGVVIRYKVVKNKVAPDGNEGAFPILFKNGIFREQELIMQCANFGIIQLGGKGGKQVYLPKLEKDTGKYVIENGQRVGVCMSQFNAARRLLIDPPLMEKLETELRHMMNVRPNNSVEDIVDEVQDSE